MDEKRYIKLKAEVSKLLSDALSYGLASVVVWEMVNKDIDEINVAEICEVTSKIVNTKPDKLSSEDRDALLSEIRDFEAMVRVNVSLLAADTDRVKSYVFESPRLPEMRGGSLILEKLNSRITLEDILKMHGLARECIIYSSGGSILAFIPSSLADQIKGLIEKRYLEETLTATITVVTETFSYSQICFGHDISTKKPGGFNQLVDFMAYKLRRGKQEKKYIPFHENIPFARYCSSCGIRPVSKILAFEEKTELCQSCYIKRKRGSDSRGYLLEAIEAIKEKLPGSSEQFKDCKEPKDLSDISGASNDSSRRRGYIGLIYADGNATGTIMDGFSSCYEYKQFSEDMLRTISVEICRALAIPGLVDENNVLRVEMLCGMGSDDIMVIVPGKYALQLATKICRTFEVKMSAYTATMSAGVVIAPHNFPVYYLEEICSQLLKSAKVRSRKLGNKPTIDFWAITSQDIITSSLKVYRENVLEFKIHPEDPESDRLELYRRPYTLDELEKLLKLARKFRKDFPVNQLYSLRDTLEEGRMQATLYYLYQRSRMSEGNRELMDELVGYCCPQDIALFPWSKTLKNGHAVYSTSIVDMLEICDLAEEV